MRGSLLGIALLLVSGAAQAAAPDARSCPRPEAPDSGERERRTPLAVPGNLRDVVSSSLYHYAVTSLSGARICVDTSWMESAERHTLSPDRRFVTFAWHGYESYGHKLIDRGGRGQVVEVGAMPVFSPSRRFFASVDQTESEFGAQSGFALWRVDPAGLTEMARLDEIPRMYDWRIDRWVGEDCIDLSAIPHDRMRGGDEDVTKLRRDRFVAKPAGKAWRILPAAKGCIAS